MTDKVLGWVLTFLVGGVLVLAAMKLIGDRALDRDRIKQEGRTAQAAGQIGTQVQVKADEVQAAETHVAQTRVEYRERIRYVEAKNPAVRDWRNEPVPNELRQLAAERKAQRERSGTSETRGKDTSAE